MENQKIKIAVSAIVNAPIEKVWNKWTNPTDIIKWNNASDGWHTPHAENDLRARGSSFSEWNQKMEVWVLTLMEFMKL